MVGLYRKQLEKLVAELGLQRSVKFHGFLPDEEAVKVMLNWQVGVAPHDGTLKNVDSGKIRFYSFCGIPSIISKRALQMVELVEKFGAGIVADTDPEMIAAAVAVMFLSDGLYLTSQEGCKKLADAFNSQTYFEQLFARL